MLIVYSASNYMYVNGIGGASGGGLRLNSEGAATNMIGLENSNNSIIFHTDSTLALTLDSSQNATFAGTITGTTATFIKDQNADSIIQFYNANAGAAAQSTIYVGNSAVAADALFLGMNGTGMTTAGGFVADGAAIGSGSGASGGLTLFAREASSGIKFYTGGHTALALEIDSSQDATFAGNVNITQTADVGVLNVANLDSGAAVGLSLTYPTTNVAAGDGLAIAIGIAGRGRSYIANSNVTTNLDASNLVLI